MALAIAIGIAIAIAAEMVLLQLRSNDAACDDHVAVLCMFAFSLCRTNDKAIDPNVSAPLT